MINSSKKSYKIIIFFALLVLIDFFTGILLSYLRDIFIKNDANGLIQPTIILIQFGIILPLLLKVTGIKLRDLGLNFKNFKLGLFLSIKYFLWIIILGTLITYLQAVTNYGLFTVRNWPILRFVDFAFHEFISILISPVLWQEIIPRGLFIVFLLKEGFDKEIKIKFVRINKAIFISSVLFALMHLDNYLYIESIQGYIYNTFIIIGSLLVGYILGYIRYKTNSLFWPIIMHTLANYLEWVVKILIPLILVNQLP